MKPSRFIAILGACVLAISSSKLTASDLVTYQGKLTNAASEALPDGQYRIGVRIWDVASGGTTPLWARKYNVPVQAGVFSVMIGSTGVAWDDPVPLTTSLKLALSGTSRFVEITVMSDAGQPEKPVGEWTILAPRQALNAVPYALNGVPPGTVVPFAGTVVPDGWLLCDGASYSTTDSRFSALFAAIQTAYGSGSGVFRVPDLRGRSAIGAGQGSGLSNRLLAQTMGAETHTLSIAELPSHGHSINLTTSVSGSHSHTYSIGPGDGGSRDKAADGDGYTREAGTSTAGAHTHSVSGNSANTGGDQPHNNMQPSIVLNYIIKL